MTLLSSCSFLCTSIKFLLNYHLISSHLLSIHTFHDDQRDFSKIQVLSFPYWKYFHSSEILLEWLLKFFRLKHKSFCISAYVLHFPPSPTHSLITLHKTGQSMLRVILTPLLLDGVHPEPELPSAGDLG